MDAGLSVEELVGPTTMSSWAKAIRRTLEARGLDARALFGAAGMDWSLLDDPTARYPVAQSARLWALAVAATSDPALGLSVASHVPATAFHALGYAVMASASLREMLERIVRYFRIVSDASALELEVDDHYCTLIAHTPAPPPAHPSRSPPLGQEADRAAAGEPAPEAIDAFLSMLVRTARSLAGRDLTPALVAFRRSQPPGDAHQRVLRAPLCFDAPKDLVRFHRADCERPLDTANRDLARHNDAIAQQLLDRLKPAGAESTRARVRAALLKQLADGEPAAEEIARQLLMSLRTLQRKLAAEQTSFDAVLAELRRELAESWLREARYGVSDIAFLLGYTDASSFTRAFRRWHGVAPSRWSGG